MKIWIDLDNTPHVPFFEPIIPELQRRGHTVLLTARDAMQVCELADKKGMKYLKIGRHYGKNPIMKVFGTIARAFSLFSLTFRERPDLSLSHGSRAQIMISKPFRIPSIEMTDYEFGKDFPLSSSTWKLVPEMISAGSIPGPKSHFRTYPGIKEDVYASTFRPDPSLLKELGLREDQLIITVRPPATEAHYHNPEAEGLFVRLMERAFNTPNARVVLLPRNGNQTAWIRKEWPHWFKDDKTIIPKRAVDGLNLIWFSDLVVSGGGTMNREAAALRVPVYSIFRGPTGAVDRYLTAEGRLVMITALEEVEQKIKFEKRDRSQANAANPAVRSSLGAVIEQIESILKFHYPERVSSAAPLMKSDAA